MNNNDKSEAEFIKAFQPNEFDQILFSIDTVIFTIKENALHVLMVKRSEHPFKGAWALPGGRVDKVKAVKIEDAARLKLKAKTGLDQPYFEQVFSDGGADMDPRGWSVTTVYFALVRFEEVTLMRNETGEDVAWQPVLQLDSIGDIAFWHRKFIDKTVKRLKDKLTYTDLPVNLMPEKFTVTQLRKAYDAILNTTLTRQVFDKRANKLIKSGVLIDTGDVFEGGGPAAKLYRCADKTSIHIFANAMTKID